MATKVIGFLLLASSLAFGQFNDRFTNAYLVKVKNGASVRIAATGQKRIANLATAIYVNGLWSSSACLLYKSTQNAGTGSTVYSFGGWTSNDATLVGSPTWGATGVTFNGSTQYGTITISGFRTATALFAINRIAPTDASVADVGHGALAWIGDVAASNKYWTIGGRTSFLSAETTICAVQANRLGASGLTWSAGEDYSEVWLTAGSSTTALWKNNSSISLNLSSGTTTDMSPSASTWTGDDIVVLGGSNSTTYSGQFKGRMIAQVFITGTPSNSARTAIVNAVNGL